MYTKHNGLVNDSNITLVKVKQYVHTILNQRKTISSSQLSQTLVLKSNKFNMCVLYIKYTGSIAWLSSQSVRFPTLWGPDQTPNSCVVL